MLERPPLDLADVLRLQRRAIEEKQTLLGRAIRAIQAAEESIVPGAAAEPTILRRIIEAIHIQDGIEVMKKYYGRLPRATPNSKRIPQPPGWTGSTGLPP